MAPPEGLMLIGGEWIAGSEGDIASLNAADGTPLAPAFAAGGKAEVERACALAAADFDVYRSISHGKRADFLDAISFAIENLGDELTERAMAETALPRARLENERGRTAGQLRMFASMLRGGAWSRTRHTHAQPERKPAPRPDLHLGHVPVGPVAVFGASNFPLAFSVAGGDTAAALAAGCPVVVKAHPAHLGTSVLVASAVERARVECGMPSGTFSLLIGKDNSIGEALVAHPAIKAVGFTGSQAGGTSLMKIAAARSEPIPVYAEMSSINPVLLFPHALAARGENIAEGFAASLTLGTGQFCTNPGLILALAGEPLEAFLKAATSALADIAPAGMLTPGIHAAYREGVARREGLSETVARGPEPSAPHQAQSALMRTDAASFIDEPQLHDEIFGPSALIVECRDAAQMRAAIEAMEGQLTISLHVAENDHPLAATFVPVLERKAGRLLVNGFGTGVEVDPAMVHGGPWPATSDGRSTSVGTLAVERFLRPVCYQDFPAALLPEALRA